MKNQFLFADNVHYEAYSKSYEIMTLCTYYISAITFIARFVKFININYHLHSVSISHPLISQLFCEL